MRKTRSTAASAEIIHSINKSFTLGQNSNVVYIIRAKLINSVIFRSWEWRRVESQFTFYCQQTWHSPQETGWAGDATTSLSPPNLPVTKKKTQKNTMTEREKERDTNWQRGKLIPTIKPENPTNIHKRPKQTSWYLLWHCFIFCSALAVLYSPSVTFRDKRRQTMKVWSQSLFCNICQS